MEDSLDIVIIGAGNVGWHIAKALHKVGFTISQIVDNKEVAARELAEEVECTSFIGNDTAIENNLIVDNRIVEGAKIYIFCIQDDNLRSIGAKYAYLNNSRSVFLHTAGSTDIEILNNFTNYGVLYFLQTFSKQAKEMDLSDITICLEANNSYTLQILIQVAGKIGKNLLEVSSEQRKVVHLSAVFTCNFTNLMFHIAQRLLNDKGMDFNILLPLIEETVKKVKDMNPQEAQTGPAIRGDKQTMQAHIDYLVKEGKVKELDLYKELSDEILRLKGGSNNGSKL